MIRDFDDDVLSDAGKNYSDTIRKIFDYFLKIVVKNGANSFDVALEMTEKMSDFLRQIQICVIETGNPDDAYTLFETLNERSLALGNLDLIKNLFFKTFVESNKKMSEQQKDSHIQKLDSFWNDEIFKGTGSKEKDLITFLAITYITGSDNITLKQSDKTVRSALRERNQESFNDLNPYTFDLAQKDFNVFKACKILLDAAEVRYNSVTNAAFEESYGNGSALKKCIHFLRGANQDTVLAGLFAPVLTYIRINEKVDDFLPNRVSILAGQYMRQ